MTEFEKTQRVILSSSWEITKKLRICSILGTPIYSRERCYSLGVVDRFEEKKERFYFCEEIGKILNIGFEDSPIWVKAWLLNHRFMEDEYI